MFSKMKAEDVIKILQYFEKNGILIWLDGGWAVDALLGEQTRSHRDADIIIQQKDVSKLRELLEAKGYKNVERDDTNSWNFVLGDNLGHEIDVHVITFDNEGNGLYGPKEKGMMYPVASLTGAGMIQRYAVKCVSAEYLVKSHAGYKFEKKDFKDVYALHKRFGIVLPSEYDKFMETIDRNKIEIIMLPISSWQEYKTLRLRALKTEPQAFTSPYEKEAVYPDDKWQQRLKDAESGKTWMFFARLNGKLVGMIGGYRNEEDVQNHRVQIWGVYVDPEARRKGIAKSLIEKILGEFKKQSDIVIARTKVNIDQEPAKKLYEKSGFKVTGTESLVLGDGSEHRVLIMELKL